MVKNQAPDLRNALFNTFNSHKILTLLYAMSGGVRGVLAGAKHGVVQCSVW